MNSAEEGTKRVVNDKGNAKRRNIKYVLEYSNATPFLWTKGCYKCFYCNELMKDPDILRNHTANVHKFENFDLVIFNRMKSSRNAAVKIDISGLACTVCPQPLTDLEQLIHHIIVTHAAEYDTTTPNCLLAFRLNKESTTCAICNEKFVYFEYLLRHANKDHLSHNYICDVCGASFQGENNLQMHQRHYHREGGYRCQYCDIIFNTLSKKIQHEKNIHMTNMLTCSHCPSVTFKSPYLKKIHLAKVHGVEELNIKCPYCPKVFPIESLMSRHLRRVHLREKNVECNVCGGKFFSSYDVKVHMTKHNGERKYVCSVCGKRFGTKCNLKSHSVIHTGIKSYVCQICNRSFCHYNSLKLHYGTCGRGSADVQHESHSEDLMTKFHDNDLIQMALLDISPIGDISLQS